MAIARFQVARSEEQGGVIYCRSTEMRSSRVAVAAGQRAIPAGALRGSQALKRRKCKLLETE